MNREEFLTEFILQSDLIERIRDNRALLEEQISTCKSDGHVGAILYLEKLAQEKGRLLTKEDIKKVQALITAEQELKDSNLRLESRHIGEYRDIQVSVPGRKCPDPKEISIPIFMLSLIERINFLKINQSQITDLELIGEIAGVYFDFEMLHPFRDGNGRTGRAIVFYLMSFFGLKLFIFTEEEVNSQHFRSLRTKDREVTKEYFWKKAGLI